MLQKLVCVNGWIAHVCFTSFGGFGRKLLLDDSDNLAYTTTLHYSMVLGGFGRKLLHDILTDPSLTPQPSMTAASFAPTPRGGRRH